MIKGHTWRLYVALWLFVIAALEIAVLAIVVWGKDCR